MAPPVIEVAGADAAARQIHLFGTAQATEPRCDLRQHHRGGAGAAAVDVLCGASCARESGIAASPFAVAVAATPSPGETPVAVQSRRNTTLFERQPVAPEASGGPALAVGSRTAGAAAETDSEDAAAHNLEHAPLTEIERAVATAATPGEAMTSNRRPGAAEATPALEAPPATAEGAGAAAAAPGEEVRVEMPAAGGDGRNACEVECVYVGQDCFFLELPDGTLACVAGLENLPATAPGAADAGDLEDQAGAAAEDQMTLARLQCHNCLRLLEFDSRAYFVQCSSCLTLNAVQNQANSLRGGRAMIVICGRCSTRNISCLGSVYVECWQCHTVCQVDYPTPAAAAGLVNEQGTSAAASAAAAAAGETATPAGRLRLRESRRGGLFASSASRRRLGRRSPAGLTHLHRRLHSGFRRSDEEESSISAVAGRGDRGTRVSTAVELPPALSSRGRGRSLVARHSFNPLPPRNIRIRLGGPPDNANNHTNNYREGTPPDGSTVVAALASCSSTRPQQRRQQRQRILWRTRPETTPSRAEHGGQSDGGVNGNRSLSLLFRLPFRRNYNAADGGAGTAAAVSRGFTGRDAGDTRGSGEDSKQATQSGRAYRRHRHMPGQLFTDRSDSDSLAGGEFDEHVTAGNAATAFGRRRVCGTEATETHQYGTTAELLSGGPSARSMRDRETVGEVEEDRRRANGLADRGRSFSENEDGGSGETPTGPCGLLSANAYTRRREAAAGDVTITPRDVQQGNNDTTYTFSPRASFPSPPHRAAPAAASAAKETSRVNILSPPLTQPSAETVPFVSEASRSAATAPAGLDSAAITATPRAIRVLPSHSGAHARAAAQNGVAPHNAATADSAAAAQISAVPHDESPTNRMSQLDATMDGDGALRKSSWRDALRHWRTHERQDVAGSRRFRYALRMRGAGSYRS